MCVRVLTRVAQITTTAEHRLTSLHRDPDTYPRKFSPGHFHTQGKFINAPRHFCWAFPYKNHSKNNVS